MTPQDPLAQLRDIHLPDPIGFWPPAPGWWLLAALLIGLSALVVFRWRLQKRRNHYRRQALAGLQQARNSFRQHKDGSVYLQAISIILHRTALSAFPDTPSVASLHSEEWLHWLDAHSGSDQRDFSEGPGRILLTGPYRHQPAFDADSVHQLVYRWVLQHRNQFQINTQKSSRTSVDKKEDARA